MSSLIDNLHVTWLLTDDLFMIRADMEFDNRQAYLDIIDKRFRRFQSKVCYIGLGERVSDYMNMIYIAWANIVLYYVNSLYILYLLDMAGVSHIRRTNLQKIYTLETGSRIITIPVSHILLFLGFVHNYPGLRYILYI